MKQLESMHTIADTQLRKIGVIIEKSYKDGLYYQQQVQYGKAMICYQNAINLLKQYSNTCQQYALICYFEADNQTGKIYDELSLAIHYAHADLYHNMVLACIKVGYYGLARAYYKIVTGFGYDMVKTVTKYEYDQFDDVANEVKQCPDEQITQKVPLFPQFKHPNSRIKNNSQEESEQLHSSTSGQHTPSFMDNSFGTQEDMQLFSIAIIGKNIMNEDGHV